MRRAMAVAAVLVAASLSAAAEEPQAVKASPAAPPVRMQPPEAAGDAAAVPQDKMVVITVTDGRVTVRPRFAIVRKRQPLRFAVRGLPPGMSLELDFAVTDGRRGPFARVQGPANPVRGRYLLDEKNSSVDTGRSDVVGFFKYDVVLRKGAEDVFALDPGVIVKNDF